MSTRGAIRSRGRGRGRGRGRMMTWEWERYKPSQDVYNGLFHVHNEVPLITRIPTDDCPLPNARSHIVARRQAEDAFRRNYYIVKITSTDSQHEGATLVEEMVHVDFTGILNYVSPRELERFENAEFQGEAEAEAIAREAELADLARKRIERNARLAAAASRLHQCPSSRGNPRGGSRGKSKGGGRGRGRGRATMRSFTHASPSRVHEPKQDESHWQSANYNVDDAISDNQRISPVVSDEEDGGVASPSQSQPQPVSSSQLRNSFVANSALSLSPLAWHLPHTNNGSLMTSSEEEDDDELAVEVNTRPALPVAHHEVSAKHPGRFDDLDIDRHRRHDHKRPQTESSVVLPAASAFLSDAAQESKNCGSHDATTADSADLEHDSGGSVTLDLVNEQCPDRDRALSLDAAAINGGPSSGNSIPGSDTEEYAVEDILDHAYEDGVLYYLVKWSGYEDSSDWLAGADLAGAAELVQEYKVRKGSEIKDKLVVR